MVRAERLSLEAVPVLIEIARAAKAYRESQKREPFTPAGVAPSEGAYSAYVDALDALAALDAALAKVKP
jgi:hypothetical protein